MTRMFGNAKLVKGFRIDVDDGRSHAVCLDQPRETGTDMGTSAIELALMSFAGCYATIFVLTAQKMRTALMDLEVRTVGTKSEEVGTFTEVEFDINVRSRAPEDRIQRIHKLTVKSCPVGLLFEKAGVSTTYKLRIENQ